MKESKNFYITVKWCVDDVKDRAHFHDWVITTEEAVTILKRIKKEWDANEGISWSTLDSYLIPLIALKKKDNP